MTAAKRTSNDVLMIAFLSSLGTWVTFGGQISDEVMFYVVNVPLISRHSDLTTSTGRIIKERPTLPFIRR